MSGLDDLSVHPDLHLTIYRIIQEQLTNIIKHAEATEAEVQLRHNPKTDCIELTVEDNGKGFILGSVNLGVGLANMQSRAENMRGKLRIEAAPGRGCQLHAEFPAQPPETRDP